MNELEKSSRSRRIGDLRDEIAAITQVPKANGEFAAKCAVSLVACYPGQQSSDPNVAKVYFRQLTEAMIGQDVDVLHSMLDAKTGLVSRKKFLPAISEVVEFIEEKMDPKRSRIGWYLDEIERLEQAEEQISIPQEVRDRQVKMARNVANEIRKAEKSMRGHGFPPWQGDCREEIAAGTIHISAEQMKASSPPPLGEER